MSRRCRPASLKKIVDTLLSGLSSDIDEQRDVSCLALKAVASEMPVDLSHLSQILDNILTKLFAILTKSNPPIDAQLASELLHIITDIFTRFPDLLSSSNTLRSTCLTSLVTILTTSRTSIRKRAVPALSALVITNPLLFDDELRKQLSSGLKDNGESGSTWAAVLTSLARSADAGKVGEMISQGEIVDALLAQAANPEQNERVEGALTAVEVLILRCPTEITPYIPLILQRSLELVKYDPNYVELDEEDVDMEDEAEEDDYEDEAYLDDEDASWKVRRSAAKTLVAIIGTRIELLSQLYQSAASILISRFSEREESVRIEILTAMETLLKQTITGKNAELASAGRNKRKRSEEMDQDSAPEDNIIAHLKNCLPNLLRGILKQLSSKSNQTRQECFVLLRYVTDALDGGLVNDSSEICRAAVSVLTSAETSTTSSLSIAALSFLSTFFRHHSPRIYGNSLNDLVPAIERCMKEKLQRISFEAFTAASALAKSIHPLGTSSPSLANYSGSVKSLFKASTDVLADTTVDGEVRERALDTLGNLLVHEGDLFSDSYETCLPLISARLQTETTALTAVQVIGRIAESPLCKGPVFEDWLRAVLPEVVVALRRSRRASGKSAEFACLRNVLSRVGSTLSPDAATELINELQTSLDSPQALSIVALILSNQPACRPAVDSQILHQVYELIKTPALNPLLADALSAFFGAYVDGDPDGATRLVPTLIDNLGKSTAIPDASRGGTASYATTAKCIATVAEHAQGERAGVLSQLVKTISSSKSSEAPTYLALRSIGEIGRMSDLSDETGLFDRVLSFFTSDSEELRSAAAYAAGNIAVGSPDIFLPLISKNLNGASDETSRLLLLHALKECILHTRTSDLEVLADSLWTSLLESGTSTSKTSSKGTSASKELGDDGQRNVKAACIGKLTTTAPARFLPRLQELLRSTPQDRAIVAAAVRYTFIDTSSSYDELIAPLIVEFLSLMHDENLIVRRLSLASLNAAIQNKPHLIIDRLAALQPLLYAETVVRPELQREVTMGPFKLIEDEGLENRKTAYETMYTLLGTCFTKVDLPTFTDRVLAAIRDVNEVKVLGLMLLLRLGQLSPASVVPRLDDVTDAFRDIMKDVQVKDDTVKQDLERKGESTSDLQRRSNDGG
ncbi:armadillo-type protein [Kockovaella imperatae]|uniref:Armadillo-type protein n=1 Tax=Kockovaella imperatae TaxID=4999 RepID=A0A1Y1UB29_9TREE|nr:armadillo-type protein [Kockovaella imperatae]ORX34727.1 armadillo-type protein [Kockovaella imperatae]